MVKSLPILHILPKKTEEKAIPLNSVLSHQYYDTKKGKTLEESKLHKTFLMNNRYRNYKEYIKHSIQ